MPHFFKIEALTEAQKSRWAFAERVYDKTRDSNVAALLATLTPKARKAWAKRGKKTDDEIAAEIRNLAGMSGNKGHSESALFARLLDGLQPFTVPPPLNYSYPWYEVIEGNKAIAVSQTEHFRTIDDFIRNAQQMLDVSDDFQGDDRVSSIYINQSRWDVLERKSPIEATVSIASWARLGFTWSLKLCAVEAKSSRTKIISWHNPNLERISTLQELRSEQLWHVRQKFEMLATVADDVKASAYLAAEAAKSKGDEAMAKSKISQAKKLLEERRTAGWSDFPSESEIEARVQMQVTNYLATSYFADSEGKLFHWEWHLKRETPTVVPSSIYLDIESLFATE